MAVTPQRGKRQPPVALGGSVVEDLPSPHVYYPNHYGAFFAFSRRQGGSPTLCACAQNPIENLLQLKKAAPDALNSNPTRMALFDSWFFPDSIADASMKSPEAGLASLTFEPGLCHRCNLVPPTQRYCHEMYGGRFMQHFGWYVNQTYLRMGVRPMTSQYIPRVCPPEVRNLIQEAENLGQQLNDEEQRLTRLAQGPARADIVDDEVTYWRNVKLEEAAPFVELRRKASQAARRVTKRIENITRQEFGFRKVGEAWVSETLLFQLVARVFPSAKVERHHRPPWLEGLEIDIYLPEMNLGFEYQGQQHFHPIKAWGGEAALHALKGRDKRKAKICRNNDVLLVEFLYSEPLTETHLRSKLAGLGIL